MPSSSDTDAHHLHDALDPQSSTDHPNEVIVTPLHSSQHQHHHQHAHTHSHSSTRGRKIDSATIGDILALCREYEQIEGKKSLRNFAATKGLSRSNMTRWWTKYTAGHYSEVQNLSKKRIRGGLKSSTLSSAGGGGGAGQGIGMGTGDGLSDAEGGGGKKHAKHDLLHLHSPNKHHHHHHPSHSHQEEELDELTPQQLNQRVYEMWEKFMTAVEKSTAYSEKILVQLMEADQSMRQERFYSHMKKATI